MDQHVHGDVTTQLRRAGISVTTAEEDGCKALADPDLLDRAAAVGCVLVSNDRDLLSEATRRQRAGIPFPGVIYAHPLRVTVGQLVQDLELIATVYEPADIAGQVEFLPL